MSAPARWWAPDGPHIGPDERDLAMLDAGDDPNLDIGAALLAAHRVGAAALEVASATPLVDADIVARCLVQARSMLAGPMVDSIAKSVQEPVYAGLLVRDLLDDAEETAVALFEQCVAKGVAPPLAASRAGAVFGVPAASLGRYRSLAIDARSNPVALADAADRALFGFISELASAEAVHSVSKATERHRDTPWVATETRGEDGEWTTTGGPKVQRSALDRLRSKLGMGSTEPKLDEQITPPEPARARPRRQRGQREQRGQRSQRIQRGSLVPAEQEAGREGERRGERRGGRRSSRRGVRITASQRKLADAVNGPEEELPPPPHEPSNDPLARMRAGLQRQYTDLSHDVVFALPGEDGEAWIKAMRAVSSTGDQLGMRVGHLIAEHGGQPDADMSEPAFMALEHIKHSVRQPEVEGIEVSQEEIDAAGGLQAQAALINQKRKELATRRGKLDWEVYDQTRATPIPGGGQQITVGTPPTVYEFVFRRPRAAVEPDQFILDPDKAYRAQGGYAWEKSFQNGVRVTRIVFVPIDDEEAGQIHKAVHRPTPWVATETRDERGEWTASTSRAQVDRILGRSSPTAEETTTSQPTRGQRKQRSQRSQRGQRQMRQAASLDQGQDVPGSGTRRGERKGERRVGRRLSQRLQHVAAAVKETPEDKTEALFDQDVSYTILGPDDWAQITSVGARSGMPPHVIHVDPNLARGLVHNSVGGSTVPSGMAHRYYAELEDSEAFRHWEDIEFGPDSPYDDRGGVNEYLDQLAGEYSAARAIDDGVGIVSIETVDPTRQPGALVVVDVASVRGHSDMELHYIGSSYVTKKLAIDGVLAVFNMQVHRYRAVDPDAPPGMNLG